VLADYNQASESQPSPGYKLTALPVQCYTPEDSTLHVLNFHLLYFDTSFGK
jgi:hypothetical protein